MKIQEIIETIKHSIKVQTPDENYNFSDRFIYTLFLTEVSALMTAKVIQDESANSQSWITFCLPLTETEAPCSLCPTKAASIALPKIYSDNGFTKLVVSTLNYKRMVGIDRLDYELKKLDPILKTYKYYSLINNKIYVWDRNIDSVIVSAMFADVAALNDAGVFDDISGSCMNNLDLEYPSSPLITGVAIKNAVKLLLYTKRLPNDQRFTKENA